MSTVYLVHQIHNDISSAMRWGEIKYINLRYFYADELRGEEIPTTFLDNLKRCADQFNPDTDFLLVAGDHAQLIAFSSLLAVRHPFFRILRFDRIASAYFPIRVPGAALVST
jgi:hypothetical protein